MLTREQLLTPVELKIELVTVKGWGEFRIRQMSQSTAAKLNQWVSPKGKVSEKRQNQRGMKMITLCVVDADGKLMLSDDDLPALESQPSALVVALAEAVFGINGYLDDEDDDLLGKSES